MPDGFNQTFAEIDMEIKNTISHRGNALKLVKQYLEQNAERLQSTL